MSVEVICPKCGTNYFLGKGQLGRKVRCGRCNAKFIAADMEGKTQTLDSLVSGSESSHLDDAITGPCPKCKKMILSDSKNCPHCKAKL